jgi:2-(1,2-epoxy-1,2-dihydrophenyl)acetyl-CoA isomerase
VIRYEVDDHVATLTLDRPERLNAIDLEVVDAVGRSLEQAADDPDVRVLIFTGAGRAFCAGGDLKRIDDAASADGVWSQAPVDERVAAVRALERTSELLHCMPKVTIAAVNGPCAGAGLSWACAADLRYAASSAVFTTAFVHAGQTGDYGGTWTLPRLVGAGKARELYLLGDRIDAAAAERIGLVSAVVDDAELMARVGAVALRLAAGPPLVLAAIKANLNDGEVLGFGELLDREAERLVRNADSLDAAEAARAFVEKRPPRFVGR